MLCEGRHGQRRAWRSFVALLHETAAASRDGLETESRARVQALLLQLALVPPAEEANDHRRELDVVMGIGEDDLHIDLVHDIEVFHHDVARQEEGLANVCQLGLERNVRLSGSLPEGTATLLAGQVVANRSVVGHCARRLVWLRLICWSEHTVDH